MTCDARAAQAEGLRSRGGEEERERGEGNEIVLVNSHGKAFYLLLPPLLLLLRQFSNCSTCSNNFGSPPPPASLSPSRHPLPLLLVTHVYASFMHSSIS